MNRLGVALDPSHANAQTTREGIALSQRPPVFTHAGYSAVFAHPRNKLDRDMRALADKGGMTGIYMLPFLIEDSRQPQLADYLRHMRHALDVRGEGHVGIGTDSMFFTVTEQTCTRWTCTCSSAAATASARPARTAPRACPTSTPCASSNAWPTACCATVTAHG